MLEEQQGLLGHSERAPTRKPSRTFGPLKCSLSFILTALLSGLIFYLFVFTIILSRPSLKATGKKYLFGDDEDGQVAASSGLLDDFEIKLEENYSRLSATKTLDGFTTVTVAPSATPTLASEDGLLELSVEELREMVGRTKGYLARDWSLVLGWNNMRYIIEAGINQAEQLGRTLILPSFVYARACEYHIDVCAKYAHMVNRNDALDTDEWKELPIEKQMGWKLPIEVMLDIPHMRRHHNVLTLSEYLHIQGLNITRQVSTGKWDRVYYHVGIDHPSLFVVSGDMYEPDGLVRVDVLPPAPLLSAEGNSNATVGDFEKHNWTPDTDFGRACNSNLLESAFVQKRPFLDWGEAAEALRGPLSMGNGTLEDAIQQAGWVILYTWDGALGMDYVKSVVTPIKQVARYPSLRGLRDDYHYVTQDILLIEGELHLGRKPGFLKFTTTKARANFARAVLHDLIPPPRVKALATKLIKRMDRLNYGHLWLSGHMRRGDFVRVGWAMEGTIREHLGKIMQRLSVGRQILERIRYLTPELYEVPDAVPNNMTDRKPPRDGSYIYLATDERSDEGLQLFKQSNIKLFADLVTMDDRREFGWTLLFPDVIALVEQQVMGLGAGYFYGQGLSSVAGGILNIRAASGCDLRTALLE